MSDLHKRLPVKKTVIEATVITYSNLRYLFRISWIAILIFAVATFFLKDHATIKDLNLKQASLGLVGLVLGSMVAVAWHRYILLGEVINKSGYFQVDQRTWNYIFFWLVVWLICLVVYSIVAAAQHFGSKNLQILLGVLTFVLLPTLLLLVRLVMVLPAKALGVEAVTLNSAWEMTHRHFGALVAGFVVMILPALPLLYISYLFDLREIGDVSAAYRALAALVESICGFVASGLWLTFMSLAFKHIYELPDKN